MRFSRIRCIFTWVISRRRAPEDVALCGHFTPPIASDTGTLSTYPLPPRSESPFDRKTTRARGARFNLEAREAVYAGVFPSGIARVQVYRESAARFNNNRVLSATETSFLVNQMRRLGAATNLIGERSGIFTERASI